MQLNQYKKTLTNHGIPYVSVLDTMGLLWAIHWPSTVYLWVSHGRPWAHSGSTTAYHGKSRICIKLYSDQNSWSGRLEWGYNRRQRLVQTRNQEFMIGFCSDKISCWKPNLKRNIPWAPMGACGEELNENSYFKWESVITNMISN